MAVQRYTAKISEIQEITEKYRFLSLELIEPHRIEFSAGQYLMLEVPGTEQKKSYSIASNPAVNHRVELLIDVSPMGLGTQYISQLKFGDEVHFLAPAGMFAVADPGSEIGKDEQNLAFVANGSGITPLRSMILDLLQTKQDKRPITLFWGMRNEASLFWADEFEQIQESFPNFTFHPVLSQASPEWPLCRGHVTDCITLHPQPEKTGYYLCGAKGMIESVEKYVLEKGLDKAHIHHEQFY